MLYTHRSDRVFGDLVLDKVRTLNDFHTVFPNEWVCFWVFVSLRWPEGFVCRTCGHTEYKKIRNRWLLRCRNCNDQISVKVGTVMEHSKLPLKKWLYAALLIVSNNGIPATRLEEYLDVCYETAYTLGQRIRHAMAERELVAPPNDAAALGVVHMEDVTQLSRAMGWVAVALEKGAAPAANGTDADEHIGRCGERDVGGWEPTTGASAEMLRMQVVRGAGAQREECEDFAAFIGGLNGDGGNSSHAMDGHENAANDRIKNKCAAVKSWLARVFRRMVGRHLKRYLWEYAYRHNRRSERISALFGTLVRDIASSSPLPYHDFLAGKA